MTLLFDSRSLKHQEAWLKTEAGRAAFELQKNLVLRLVNPKAGERLLDVNCGSGLYLQAFREEGLYVTGLDSSTGLLDQAKKHLGSAADLFPGQAEDMPFEDNEFDIVLLILVLEHSKTPRAALTEAFRVARNRVFVGTFNGLSAAALAQRTRGLVKPGLYKPLRYYTPWGLMNMISELTDPSQIRWRTVHFLPPGLCHKFSLIESRPEVQVNPFGAFLGLAAKITPTVRIENLAVKSEFKFKRQPAPTPTTFSAGKDGARVPDISLRARG